MAATPLNRAVGRDSCPDHGARGPSRREEGLSFPYARGGAGGLVHIDAYDGSSAIHCLGCGAEMHARADGGKVRRHFAHRVRVQGTCSHESAIHAAAKQAICSAFAAAKATAGSYKLLWTCPGCETPKAVDLVRICDRVAPETEIVAGVISDLAFSGTGQFAIEVVVTHAPEPQALTRYEAASVPVFLIQPTWDTIAQLADCVRADGSHFVSVEKCSKCRSRRNAREASARDQESALARLRRSLMQLVISSLPRAWNTDKRGNTLSPRIAARLIDTGRRLCGAGFRQAQQKPWLFVLKVNGIGAFFANLGGTEEVPIWEDTTPLYHWELDDRVAEHEEALVRLVRDYLAAQGVELRTSFYSPY